MGSDTTDWNSNSSGVIPRTIRDLFDQLKVDFATSKICRVTTQVSIEYQCPF